MAGRIRLDAVPAACCATRFVRSVTAAFALRGFAHRHLARALATKAGEISRAGGWRERADPVGPPGRMGSGHGILALMPLLRTRGIGAAIGAEVLFEDVELALEAGERVCVTGRNGAGKSTFLSVLAGLREPDAGFPRTPAGAPGFPRTPGPSGRTGRPCPRHRPGRLCRRTGSGAMGTGLAGRSCPEGSGDRGGCRFRVAVGRLPAAPADRARTGNRARPSAPRRADQPSRSPGHRMAGAAGRGLWRRGRVHDPRSRAPRTACDPESWRSIAAG